MIESSPLAAPPMAVISVSTAASSRPRTRSMALAVMVAAAAAILGSALADGGDAVAWQWLHWVAKPLATLLVLAAAFAWPPITSRYRRWVAAGLVCSLCGDVLLMWPADLFVAGLLAFLAGHVCFIAAFLGDSRLGTRPLAWLACLLVAGANLALLWPSIPAVLAPAVALYALVLSGMGAQALGRAWQHAGDRLARPARCAAIGGVLFMASDSLLAWNRFHGAIPLAALWVLGSYYAAVWFIARSVAQDETVAGPASLQASLT